MVLLRQLLGDVLRRLRVRQGRTLREVSDNFALAELQNEPVMSGAPREPGLRVSVPARPVSAKIADSTDPVDDDFGSIGDVTDMVTV